MEASVGKKRTFLILIFLFFLTFLPRLTFVLVHPGTHFAPDVTNNYLVTSTYLLEGKGFRASTGGALHAVAPLYPLYLALARLALGDGYFPISLSIFLLDGLTCLVIYLIARRIFDGKIAFLSAAAFALYPPLIRLSGRCNVDVLLLFFVSLTAYFLVRTFQEEGLKNPILCGICCGLAALTKPVTLFFPIFLFPWFLIAARKRIKKGVTDSMVVLVAMAVVISPWIIRQYIVIHRFVPIISQERGMLQSRADYIFHEERLSKYDPELSMKRYRTPTSQAAAIFIKAVIEHPLGYLRSVLWNFLHLYFRLSSRRFVPALFLMQAVVLGFALVGMFRYFVIARGKRAFPILIVLAYFLFIHSTIAGANVRYGMQTIPFMLMFGAYEVLYIIKGKEFREP